MSHAAAHRLCLSALLLLAAPAAAQDDPAPIADDDDAVIAPAEGALSTAADEPPPAGEPLASDPGDLASMAPADSAAPVDDAAAPPRVRRAMRAVRAPVALGLELGEASGLSVGYRIRGGHEVVGLVGFSPWFQALTLRSDYLYHFWRWVPSREHGVALSFFGGGGLRLGLFEPRPSYLRELPLALGARVPLGVRATLPPLPVELDLSVAPGLDVAPELRFRMEGGLALRFHVDLLSGETW